MAAIRGGDWAKACREYGLGKDVSDLCHVRFWVADTGTGIPTSGLDRIFEPFYTTKNHGKGTGLGLSVAHGVVRAHDGVIQVKTAPDEGTCFEIYLPIKPHSPLEAVTKPQEQVRGNGECILVVDDDPKIRELLSRILSENNYKVTSVPDGRPALEHLVTGRACDLVLSDLAMPFMGGESLAKEIQKRRLNVPIILMSALIDERTLEHHQSWGVDALIDKPIIPNDLFSIIQTRIHGE